jgi:thiaminase/transcriptional activator TenA
MNFSNRLYEKVKDIWGTYYEHPFIKGIGNGDLEIDKFKYYMIQDYLYLLDYAKIYALGVVKADSEEVMKGFAKSVDAILNGEMSIHRSYMKRLNITQEEVAAAKVSLTNISYTHYMLAVSQMGSLADVAAALLACMWSYLEIGKYLNRIPGAAEHEFYGEWIKGYISKEYEESTKWIIDLVNNLAENMNESELVKLEKIFINTSKYEYMFWDMSYNKGMN